MLATAHSGALCDMVCKHVGGNLFFAVGKQNIVCPITVVTGIPEDRKASVETEHK